jgi:hypothetical protein
MPVVYEFESIPPELRVQAFYSLEKILNMVEGWITSPGKLWWLIEKIVREEHGLLEFPYGGRRPDGSLTNYLLRVENTNRFLDVIEIGLRLVQTLMDQGTNTYRREEKVTAVKEEIEIMNQRFRQHRSGYQFVGWPGMVVREDSQYLHAAVVEPAIISLHSAGFAGPLDEFMKALGDFRRGDNKDAMDDALKAFESTMKAICDARGWHREQDWTAKNLIKAMIDNGFFPAPMESFLSNVRSLLESGAPTLRNRMSAHGQGAGGVEVPDYLAAYMLHLTASNIVLLMSAFEKTPVQEST